MAGEHDFAPLSDETLRLIGTEPSSQEQPRWAIELPDEARAMARELRASRAAMRAVVEAESDDPALMANTIGRMPSECRWMQQYRAIRALVAHVGAEGEGR